MAEVTAIELEPDCPGDNVSCLSALVQPLGNISDSWKVDDGQAVLSLLVTASVKTAVAPACNHWLSIGLTESCGLLRLHVTVGLPLKLTATPADWLVVY